MFRLAASWFCRSLAIAALAVGMAGCVTTDGDRRHFVPIPSVLNLKFLSICGLGVVVIDRALTESLD